MVTSKTVDGVLMYLCAIETNAAGYISGAGMDDNGDTWLAADELASLMLDATKLVDGHLVVDADKIAAIEAEQAVVTPTAEQRMIAALTLQYAALKSKGATA